VTHAFEHFRLRFPNFKGFAADPGNWIQLAPITVLVGRNNSGKSAVIDALRVILTGGKSFKAEYHRAGAQARIEISKDLTEADLRTTFIENMRSGHSAANDWIYGRHFAGQELVRAYDGTWSATLLKGPNFSAVQQGAREKFEADLTKGALLPKGSLFQIAAERNVQPEPENDPTPVAPNGTGLTNLIRGFLYDSRYPMRQVEEGLKNDLNRIYRGDTSFERILCRRDPTGLWEIYLTEDGGVPVRLSESGSSLKSVFIILATIRLNPIVDKKSSLDGNVFCVEEPENNLHPALLRRLLDFLASSRTKTVGSIVITTHSATAIDWASRAEDAGIFHIRRGNLGSYVQQAKEYPGLRALLEDLDIRASEILQANGVIWVEGPSDRLYIRKWLELASSGFLQEGVHYSTMFYGGKLLSHLSALAPNEAEKAVSLLRLNRNLALLIDSDRRRLKGGKFRADLNATKKRLIREAENTDGFVWVTKGREIENYLSPRLVGELSSGKHAAIDDYESVPSRLLGEKADKVALAHDAVARYQKGDLDRLDLSSQLALLMNRVLAWNAIKNLS
jgi:predicted ATPase